MLGLRSNIPGYTKSSCHPLGLHTFAVVWGLREPSERGLQSLSAPNRLRRCCVKRGLCTSWTCEGKSVPCPRATQLSLSQFLQGAQSQQVRAAGSWDDGASGFLMKGSCQSGSQESEVNAHCPKVTQLSHWRLLNLPSPGSCLLSRAEAPPGRAPEGGAIAFPDWCFISQERWFMQCGSVTQHRDSGGCPFSSLPRATNPSFSSCYFIPHHPPSAEAQGKWLQMRFFVLAL